MRVLVTGGAGFIGSHVVQQLTGDKEVEQVTVLDALTYASSVKNIITGTTFVHGNICDYDLVESLIAQADVCINTAAETHVDRSISNADPFVQTNVVGVQTLLQACLKYGVPLVHVSTDEVYGSLKDGDVANENYPLKPRSPYAASKAAADMLIESYRHTYGLRAVITRGCNTYGPRQFPEKLIPVAINNILRGVKVPVYGTGNNIREWMHVTDHAHGIVRVMHRLANPFAHSYPGVFNLGSGFRCSNLHILALLSMVMKESGDVFTFVEDRKGHDARYALDSSLVKELHSWEPTVGIMNGIDETVRWYKEFGASHWENT